MPSAIWRARRSAPAARSGRSRGCGRAPICRQKAKVGNFCEVKKATIEEGAKVNHLTYIGDARVGAGANIGAGTITCNYDGYSTSSSPRSAKAPSSARIRRSSRRSTIGDGAYVASGSVITEDVPDDALAFGRARQKTMPGKAQGTARARRAVGREKVKQSG